MLVENDRNKELFVKAYKKGGRAITSKLYWKDLGQFVADICEMSGFNAPECKSVMIYAQKLIKKD
jgi:hypothetical protein